MRFATIVAAAALTVSCKRSDACDGGALRGKEGRVQFCERAGKKHGMYREWFPGEPVQLRRTGEFRDGAPTGSWTVYHRDGTLAADQRYEGGVLEGDGVIYDAAGAKVEDGRYHAGVRVGVWTRYEDALPKRRTEYVAGGREERWTVLFTDGTPQATGIFREGKKQGPFTMYYPGGAKALEGQFVDGLRKGRWIRWDEQGAVVSDEVLDENEPYSLAEELAPGVLDEIADEAAADAEAIAP